MSRLSANSNFIIPPKSSQAGRRLRVTDQSLAGVWSKLTEQLSQSDHISRRASLCTSVTSGIAQTDGKATDLALPRIEDPVKPVYNLY
ncbi:hypothetical protein MJO28_004600 [Puccinia striiformis f. sp. tritici]|uniref:Uncharacterized protein n=1 Tax=Puccinia striiformis f. sp. tritici TaxID=168172 RepID=A0ACC0EQZ3_9BASI|nr:hypothetical protein MJO28_017512 [Puccinia striiformis f. sp. tritici]KAI7957505.1 hypothetical protein MJO28_004600 [Puccinia striiformis f. sp. tritici]KAI7963164.1 hypothetical protein MJO29_003591 [Puccinia striiformis f. sp. tritici]KAI7963269.1 hypothetical protein MJO29_003696 [Puccinia striiformis f. sp. tritici]